MMKKTRAAAIAALGLGVALAASACAGGSSGSSSSSGGGSSSGGNVTMTFWTNATPGPGLVFLQNAVKSFDAAHPGVTIKMQAIQNEDYDGKLQTALASNTAPDIFFQRGGGKMLAMVNANQVAPLTLTAADQANVSAAALAGETLNGKIYAIPMDQQPEGIYYSKDLFQQAGITSTPTTIPELEADVAKLKAIKRRADRGRRQGRVARRPLVLQLRPPRVQPGHDEHGRHQPQVHRPVLDEGR